MTKDPRAVISARLADVGLVEDRFIKCKPGSKASHDHDNRTDSPPKGQNYGVYATATDRLVLIDVDDYDELEDSSGVAALAELPPTLEVASPHGGTHRYYAVEISDDGRFPAAVLVDEFGAKNPAPSFGEVRVANQYVVGPGSQLDGCDKEWCDGCDEPGGGRYTIGADRAIATVAPDDLVPALRADPALEPDDDSGDAGGRARDESGAETSADAVPDDLDDRLQTAFEHDDKLKRLWRGDLSDYGGDRSEAECALAAKLGFWFGRDKSIVRDLLDDRGRGKWAERTDEGYRGSVLEAVDLDTEYYEPGSGADPPMMEELIAHYSDEYDSPEEVPSDLFGDAEAPTAGDGGTATATPDADDTHGVEWETEPWAVLQVALGDPSIPIQQEEDDDPPTLRDLRASEAAYATWEVMERTGYDYRLLGVRHGPVYGYEDGVWSRDTGDDLLRRVTVDSLGPAFSENVLSNMEQHLRRARTYGPDELGAPDGAIATESGLLDLGGRETEPLEPTDLALHKIPHEFDPDADAPQFDTFVEESVKSADRDKLQEYAGYLLWHHAQPFGKALFLVGPTDSGKGTFLRILKGVIGEDALASESMDSLTDSRWGAAQLYGKWANIRNEVTPEEVRKVERFKELTGGGDRISAEFKGEQKFDFDATQKFIFAMNQMPEVKGADGAFWNRLLFAEFPDTVPDEEKDTELDVRIIEDEGAGVLNWMLEGLDRLMEQGHFTGERTTDDKKELCNAFGGAFDRFIRDAVEITGDDSDAVVKSDLHQLAQAFADYLDMEPDWNRQSGFTRMLKQQQGVGDMETRSLTSDSDKHNVYLGIRPLEHVIEELDVDMTYGEIYDDGDSDQSSLI